MNKYIEYDIHNGVIQLKCAVMNILKSLELQEIDLYVFNPYISRNLIIDCMINLGWIINDNIYIINSIKFELIDKERNLIIKTI